MKEFFNKDWDRSDKFLAVAAAMLFGIVAGILFAPIKKGIYCGNHNGNTYLPDSECE